MTTPTDHPPARTSRLAVGATTFAVLVALLAAMAGFGSRWGLWHFSTGFDLLRWSAYLAIAAALLCGVAVARALWRTPRLRGWVMALGGAALALAVVIVPWQWQQTAREVPPIHDITTDTEDPPEFVAVAPLRADARNPVEYPGQEVAALQREAYPHIAPLMVEAPPAEVFEQALRAAQRMGWEVVDAAPEEGRIEATDRTFWFGFYDDVVIRLRPEGEGTRVDVRSKSRVGGSDVGTNARRIEQYLRRLRR